MRPTGIIRRIDDLGRVVIPKEIRKAIRIIDGDALEIFLDENGVYFKKYSVANNIAETLKEMANDLYFDVKSDRLIAAELRKCAETILSIQKESKI